MAIELFDPAIGDNSTPLARTPWNNLIYPGNYVTHLNSYRDQGVAAIPGVAFFRSVGAIVLNPDVHNLLVNGVLEDGTYTPQILSPDMRRDDQPRRDRPQVIPEGAIIYRTAVNAVGVREATVAGTTEIELSAPAANPTAVAAVAEADGYFSPVGTSSLFEAILDDTNVLAAPVTVQVDTSADLIASLKESAGACRNSPSAIITEICYYMHDPAPDADDLHLPYAVESGSDAG